MCLRKIRIGGLALAGVLGWLAAAPGAVAQYDRDGRFIPSPNGVPLDPSARPIPMYSGTPGEAIGTPILPRGPTASRPPDFATPPLDRRPVSSSRVPLTPVRCRQAWSPAFGVGKAEFARRCAKVLRLAPSS